MDAFGSAGTPEREDAAWSHGPKMEDLDPGAHEDMVAVMISRLYPEAQRIDGSGGDGGRAKLNERADWESEHAGDLGAVH